MTIIKKGIKAEYFEDILSGKKRYELRLGSLEIKEGDTFVLEEEDSETGGVTGRTVEKKVTHVGKFKLGELFWTEEQIRENGVQIISLG